MDVILRILGDRKVLLFEIYGIGSISTKQSAGTLQIAVAQDIISFLRRSSNDLKVVVQEPILSLGEIEYLKKQRYMVRDTTTFSDYVFREVQSQSQNKDGVLICYMIHGEWTMLDEFLSNYWSFDDLRRIIVIGNSLRKLELHPKYNQIPDRVKQFMQFTREFRIEDDELNNAFTNTSVIWVDNEKLEKMYR